MDNLKTQSLSEKVSGTLHPGEQPLLDVLTQGPDTFSDRANANL
jgi:hypothetical protein